MSQTIPSNFWRMPVYLPYLQPPLTPQAIADAEQKLGVKLPRTYLKLLEEQNGGYVRLQLPDTVDSMIWGIGPHFPNLVGQQWWHEYDVVDGDDEGAWLPDDPRRLIAFDGDGHWHLCFDYRDGGPTDEPSIAFVDFESESESVVALSFDEFLDMVEDSVAENTYGVSGATSIDAIVAALEPILGAKFDPPDSDSQGYPMYRCALGTQDHPGWLWLSANEVPRGFVRETDPRYDELKDLLPGTAFRMPDHAQYPFILECTDGEGVADRVLAACKTASLTLTPLWSEA